MMGKFYRIVLLLLMLGGAFSAPSYAEDSDEPAILVADQMDYDANEKYAIASGNVEVTQGGRVLLADKVTYYEVKDLIIAEGNVSILEPDGTVYFADKVELKEEMKKGLVKHFSAKLIDGSTFTALNGTRLDENNTELFSAVYTPCKVTCEAGKKEKPTWHFRAKEIHIDQEAQKVSYEDATLEFLDVPVAYTPIFFHPTPGADNKSGILTPTYSYSNNLGNTLSVPYYYVLGQDHDVTITPIYTSLEGPVVKGEYRARYDNGSLESRGSLTVPKDRDALGRKEFGKTYRGHIDARGGYRLSDEWLSGGQLRRSTDDTYMARYGFGSEPLLTSRAYLQGLNFIPGNNRNSAMIQALSFQGLTVADSRKTSPFVLPLAEFNYTSNPLKYGSRFSLNSSLLSLSREVGADTNRISLGGNLTLPYTTSNGHIFEATAKLRGDAYYIQNHRLSNGKLSEGTKTRLIPEASLSWKYPLIRRGENTSITIEPLAALIVSPNVGNVDEIPNEDSSTPEFTDLNMFSSNRYSGIDSVEGGPRMFYGARSLWDLFDKGTVSATFGQALRLSDSQQFPLSNDISSRISDYVGRISYGISPISVNYRFRLDRDKLETRRDELDFSYLSKYYYLQASYLRLNKDPFIQSNEEINGTLGLYLTPEWTASFSTRRDLKLNTLTSASSGLTYQDECFTFLINANRDLANDRDLQENTSLTFQVLFKNLN